MNELDRQGENVVITGSATHGLNLAIRSLLGPGDRVVISGYEHNAVTRPLHAIPGLSVTVIDTPPFRPDLAAEEFCRAIRQKRPRAVVCTHVSNVFGMIFGLAMTHRPDRANEISGLMVMAISGGAVLPPVMGYVQGLMGPAGLMAVLVVCLLYLLGLSFFAVLMAGGRKQPNN